MKLFFDPIRLIPDRQPLDGNVATDMQISDILHNLISDKDMECDVFDVIMEFCDDPSTILYRQALLCDFIRSDDIFNMFSALKDDLAELKVLFEMKMFTLIPETKALKTFLIAEKFFDIYSSLYMKAKIVDTSALSDETGKIISAICSAENTEELDKTKQALTALRKDLNTLERVRFNRYFSRGQNIENSVIPATAEPSVTAHIAKLAEALGLDTSIASDCALQSSRELTRPVFIAIYKEYRPVFDKIEEFDKNHGDTFDTAWLDLIPKLSAMLGFAVLFRNLKSKGFSFAEATIAESTKICGLYSLLLVNKGLSASQIVSNDYISNSDTPFYFIMGPNAGGKTIFLSSVGLGQLFFQACGLVPADKAEMKVMRRLYTHFPVEEYNDNSGRLVEEQGRVEKIFADVSYGNCLALFNETYSSTKADIAYKYSVELCENVRKYCLSGIFVTHLHSLKDYTRDTADKVPHIGALTAMKDKATGARTYKIEPLSEQNSSFANDILSKYDMTVEQMFHRIKAKKEADGNVSEV